MELHVAVAQMEITMGRPEHNESPARQAAAQAADHGAELLVLPELWPTGYDLDRCADYEAPLDGGPFAAMAAMAERHNLYVLGTALEKNPTGAPYNTAALFDPKGEIAGVYRKVHLIPLLDEDKHLSPGNDMPVFDLPWGRTALAICYDLRFPELWQRYTAAGAQLILVPAEWPARRVEHWRLLLRARAVENQLFVVGCNRAGSGEDGEFGGHSSAVDPWGRVLVEGGWEPGLFRAKLNLDEVSRCREMFPFLNDRRPEVYG